MNSQLLLPQADQSTQSAKLFDWLTTRCGIYDRMFENVDVSVKDLQKEQIDISAQLGHTFSPQGQVASHELHASTPPPMSPILITADDDLDAHPPLDNTELPEKDVGEDMGDERG